MVPRTASCTLYRKDFDGVIVISAAVNRVKTTIPSSGVITVVGILYVVLDHYSTVGDQFPMPGEATCRVITVSLCTIPIQMYVDGGLVSSGSVV